MSNKKAPTRELIHAANKMFRALQRAEMFMRGFEDDETQNVKPQLAAMRHALKLAQGRVPDAADTLVIEIEGGLVTAIFSNLAQIKLLVVDRDNQEIGEDPATQFEPEPLNLAPEDIQTLLA